MRQAAHSFFLEVETTDFVRALRDLLRYERGDKRFELRVNGETLTISAGRTTRELKTCGTWPLAVAAEGSWAAAIVRTPPEAAVTTLRVNDDKLFVRDFGVSCAIIGGEKQTEDDRERASAVEAALSVLAQYPVSERQLQELISRGDREKARLWGPGDGALINDVATIWLHLLPRCAETGEIRRLLNKKSRDFWRQGASGPKLGGPYGRYSVSNEDLNSLVSHAEGKNPPLWSETDARLGSVIAEAWKYLAPYGIEPSDILGVLKGENARFRTKEV